LLERKRVKIRKEIKMIRELLESAKDLSLYKRLVELFSEFVDNYPGTGMGIIYRKILDTGMKCVPKDKQAILILDFALSSMSLSDFVNKRFDELPIIVRPIYKVGNRRITAFYCKSSKIYDKVFDLLDFEGIKGGWSDANCKKVSLVDLNTKEAL